MKLNIKKLGLTLSTFFALGFIIDYFWHLTMSGMQRDLYLDLLQLFYIGFTGFNFSSFVSGLIQIYIWGWITACVFGYIWNYFHKD